MRMSVIIGNMYRFDNFHRFTAILLSCFICVCTCSCNTKSNYDFVSDSTSEIFKTHEENSSNIDTFDLPLSDTNAMDAETYSETNSDTDIKKMYAAEKTEVRTEPSNDADVYCVLSEGSEILVLSLENDWYAVNIQDNIYYINSEFLQDEQYELKDDASTTSEKKVIVIDAGHQQICDLSEEPIGPGASEMKAKVTGGTSGAISGMAEYELTLILALKLQEILEERGYEVIQVRTENDVNISNIERAEVANNVNADAFIRIHANGSENPDVNGAMTLCQTINNPYNSNIYEQCKALSENILDELVASTGCNKQYVWETDTMSGINWASVPVTIVEVGYMTNPQEDMLMSEDLYQEKICTGIANGIDNFLDESKSVT